MLTIDARLAGNKSGIGTYLRHIVPGILSAFPEINICLLGDYKTMAEMGWLSRPNVHAVRLQAAMYSLLEQWKTYVSVPKGTNLFFSPHYNVPLLYRGRMLVTVHDLFHLVSSRETNIR